MPRKDIYAAEQWPDMARQAAYNSRLLAELIDVCPRQLRRYTHKFFNSSPQQWLNEQRLTKAASMLQSNELVKAVAFELGFKSVSHFSHAFKSRYGICPSVFQKQGIYIPIKMSAPSN